MAFDLSKVQQIAKAADLLHKLIREHLGKDVAVAWAVAGDEDNSIASGASYSVGVPADRFNLIKEKIVGQLDAVPYVSSNPLAPIKRIPIEG